jgi:hypothetical protein
VGLTAAAVSLVVSVALGVVEIENSAAARGETGPTAAPLLELASMVAAPHVVFRHTGVDRGYGLLSMAPLDRADARPVTLGMACERVAFAAGQGICLQADRGVFTTFKAVLFDRTFNARSTITLDANRALDPPVRRVQREVEHHPAEISHLLQLAPDLRILVLTLWHILKSHNAR